MEKEKEKAEELPLVITDEFGGDDAAVWDFCGNFPLAAIAQGRRACLPGWRTPTDWMNNRDRMQFISTFGMVAVVCGGSGSEKELLLEREYEAYVEGDGVFANIEDMLCHEWYLERPKDGEE